MTTLKRSLSLFIALCLLVAPIRVSAIDDADTQIDTAEKLVAAIANADNGDTIVVTPGIVLTNVIISSDKYIVIVRDISNESDMIKPVFLLEDGATISGLIFSDDSWSMGTIQIVGQSTKITNCTFEGHGESEDYQNEFLVLKDGANAEISNCTFINGCGCAILIDSDAIITMDSCNVIDCMMGSVNNCGNATLNNCCITGSECVDNSGTLVLHDCILEGNSPWSEIALDITCNNRGSLYISHETISDRVYFNRRTGEMLSLPFENNGEINILCSNTSRDFPQTIENGNDLYAAIAIAEEWQSFAIAKTISGNCSYKTDKHIVLTRAEDFTDAPMFEFNAGGTLQGFSITDTISDFPCIEISGHLYGYNETGIKDCSFSGGNTNIGKQFIHIKSGKNINIENCAFSEPENIAISSDVAATILNCTFWEIEIPKDDNTDNPSQEPTDDNNTDNQNSPTPSDDAAEDSTEQNTTPDEQEQPTAPSDSGGNSSHHPTPTPTQATETPTGDVPAEQPTKDISALVCNGTALDASRTVILKGYGDGATHEDDVLTRAQLATIIYRLVDADALSALAEVAPVEYADVSPLAWYAPYVDTISRAGIVNGIGAGKFAPNEPLTWAQLVTVLTRFVPEQESRLQYIICPEWAKGAMQTAIYYGWILDVPYLKPNAPVTRGEATAFINIVLEQYSAQ